MSKDNEYLTENSEPFIYEVMIRLIPRQQTVAPAESS
jgi:hypothetical protein